MDAGRHLAAARRRAGLSQRELAARAGMPQSTVARIEAGSIDPRASTLNELLRVCGWELEVMPRIGIGVDRTQIRERLRWTPQERVRALTESARQMAQIRGRARGRKR